MLPETDINRFIEAQDDDWSGYKVALTEIQNGKKTSHWIWYIFPQLRGLGFSFHSHYYGIADRNEAEAYLNHPILSARLREITQALLTHKDKSAVEILGPIDAKKVKSCMTLFNHIKPDDIFAEVLNTFYNNKTCTRTLKFLQQ